MNNLCICWFFTHIVKKCRIGLVNQKIFYNFSSNVSAISLIVIIPQIPLGYKTHSQHLSIFCAGITNDSRFISLNPAELH
jgi:hypothetical protein